MRTDVVGPVAGRITSLAERRRQERREQRDRARYRPYPSQNQSGSRQERLRGQRHVEERGEPEPEGPGEPSGERESMGERATPEGQTPWGHSWEAWHEHFTWARTVDSCPVYCANGGRDCVSSGESTLASIGAMSICWWTQLGRPSIIQSTQRIWRNFTIPWADDRESFNVNQCGWAQSGHQGQFCTVLHRQNQKKLDMMILSFLRDLAIIGAYVQMCSLKTVMTLKFLRDLAMIGAYLQMCSLEILLNTTSFDCETIFNHEMGVNAAALLVFSFSYPRVQSNEKQQHINLLWGENHLRVLAAVLINSLLNKPLRS